MANKKINILVICLDTVGGVGFYRSIQPHEYLKKVYSDDFNVTIETKPDFNNLENFKNYDIIHFHKGVYSNQDGFYSLVDYCKENKITTIIDIDDYWNLGSHHPLYFSNVKNKEGEKVRKSLQMCDYVTTTTELFASKIKPFNKNVVVFPNSIDENDERFKINKTVSNKLRIGMVMGSTHLHDLHTMDKFVGKLSKDILDKVCFVLCGFDTRGHVKTLQKNGEIIQRPIQPKETVWYEYEKILTNDYKNISPTYKNFLMNFIPNSNYQDDIKEGYKRRWTLPMDKYYQHYNDVDVLFAPLEENDFNYCKSQLKVIECAFSKTAFVGSNFGPYTIDLRNIYQKGGNIDKNGNSILIDNRKAHKDWAKTVEKLVKNPEIVKLLQDNLHNEIIKKYNLSKITKDRVEFYKKIVKKN